MANLQKIRKWCEKHQDQWIGETDFSMVGKLRTGKAGRAGKIVAFEQHPRFPEYYRIPMHTPAYEGDDTTMDVHFKIADLVRITTKKNVLVLHWGSSSQFESAEFTAMVNPPQLSAPPPAPTPLKVEWPVLAGYTLVTCYACKGLGGKDHSCKNCEGTGQVLTAGGPCGQCDGSGYTRYEHVYREPCKQCNGIGWYNSLRYSEAVSKVTGDSLKPDR